MDNGTIKKSSSRERFIDVLEHKIPDRIPVFDFLFSKPLYKEVLGKEIKNYNDIDCFLLAEALNLDATLLTIGTADHYTIKELSRDTFMDEWGTIYKKMENAWPGPGVAGHTIKSREDLKSFKIPDGSEEKRYYEASKAIEKNKGNLATLALVPGPFTIVMLTLGITRLSECIYSDQIFVDDLLRIATDFGIQLVQGYKRIGSDAIIIADDLGFAGGTFFNPEWYREKLFPYFDELIKEIKSSGMFSILHCDGDINRIVNDIVNLGFDALNPLERKSNMDLREIRKKYGNRITLSGNVDSSTTLVFGNPDDIIKETLQCMLDGGENGSYILSSDHSLHYDIPNKNIFIMIETGKKYGKYPLNIKI